MQHGLDKHRVKRSLVVDLDVHQGDGTAEIFKDEPRVVRKFLADLSVTMEGYVFHACTEELSISEGNIDARRRA